MLRDAYAQGFREALSKFALAPTTPADSFVNGVEGAKDVPPDPSMLQPPEPPPPQGPQVESFPFTR